MCSSGAEEGSFRRSNTWPEDGWAYNTVPWLLSNAACKRSGLINGTLAAVPVSDTGLAADVGVIQACPVLGRRIRQSDCVEW